MNKKYYATADLTFTGNSSHYQIHITLYMYKNNKDCLPAHQFLNFQGLHCGNSASVYSAPTGTAK